MYTITFKVPGSQDKKIDANPGDNILELAQKLGVVIDAPCSGNGTCGKCRVRLISGVVNTIKNPHMEEEDFQDGWRLACQSSVAGDAILWVPAEAGAFQKGIQTADLSSQAELERYEAAIGEIFSGGLNRSVRQGLGLAVDIGTTTVTAALLDLQTGKVMAKASAGNGQIRYGADVINRIIQSSTPGGREKLRAAIGEETLHPMIQEICTSAGIEATDIKRCVIAGNTTMEHLFALEVKKDFLSKR